MVTLGWALVLLILAVYFFALLFLVIVGDLGIPFMSEYFDNVPRAVLTIYRCSFGDCSTDEGLPLFEQFYKHDQWRTQVAVIIICIFGFFFWVGLFNVIAAIFVESTMSAATGLVKTKKSQRLANKELWAKNVSILIRLLWESDPDKSDAPSKLSEHIAEVASLDLPCSVIRDIALTPEAREALLALDICEDDHGHLADILDPDNGGTIGVLDMMDGLNRLRGDPRRSDIVTVDLMVRALQLSILDLHKDIKKVGSEVRKAVLIMKEDATRRWSMENSGGQSVV